MLRVMQWNIHMTGQVEGKAKLIKEEVGQGPAIVCLEEVYPSPYKYLCDHLDLDPQHSSFSLKRGDGGASTGSGRSLGVAVLAFGLPIIDSELVVPSVKPERTLSVLLDGDFGRIRVVAFHSLTGVRYHEVKATNFSFIAEYLRAHRPELDFLCFDGNEPSEDSVDADKLVFGPRKGKWVNTMPLIMGPDRVHDLTDSYVGYLRNTGQAGTKRNPLAVSYRRTGSGEEMRYDYIMHASKWQVLDCKYPYKESTDAGSDHSAVIADYELLQAPEPTG
jgi:hypothetical protein